MTRRSLAGEISLKNKTAVVTDGEYYSGGKIEVLQCRLAE
jgi:hypothetical protein